MTGPVLLEIEESIGPANQRHPRRAGAAASALIATACPYCATMMDDGVTTLGHESVVAARDIAELVADALAAP